jgi:signal-transduction protein with cAMP-binding, CBS, and nucleotidyltransferase domain
VSDLLRRLVFTAGLVDTEAGRKAGETPVHLAMSGEVKTVAPNDHLEAAARLMLVERIGAVVAVEDGRVAGILTESDVFRALWSMLRRPGTRRITLELAPQSARAEPDVAALALRHGCRLRALLECPREDGGRLVDLVVEGGSADALVAALWQLPATVLCA